MRINILNIFAVLAIAAGMTSLASCNKTPATPVAPDDPDEPGQVVEPEKEVLGHYTIGGIEHDINSTTFTLNDNYHVFYFSPFAEDETQTEYVVFYVRNYWANGEPHDINDPSNPLDHNDDYLFLYEDLDWYYSPYHALQSGTFCISYISGNKYRVEIDVRLPDGTPFVMDFTHDYSEE